MQHTNNNISSVGSNAFIPAILGENKKILTKGCKAIRKNLNGVLTQQDVRDLIAKKITVSDILTYAKQTKKRISQPAQLILAEYTTGVVLH